MLLHHFGTRDALLRAVLEQARRRQVEVFGELLHVRAGEPCTATLLQAWTRMTGAEGQPFLRMFTQLRPSAMLDARADRAGADRAFTDFVALLVPDA